MAKPKPVLVVGAIPARVERPTEKEGGLAYMITGDVIMARGLKIPATYTVGECTDGWFQVYQSDGYRHFFRVAPAIIDSITNKIAI